MFADVKLLQINFLPTSEISPIHKMLSFYNNLGGVDCILMWPLFMWRQSSIVRNPSSRVATLDTMF